MVGHRHPIAGDRRSNCDRRLARHRQTRPLAEILGQRVIDHRIVLYRVAVPVQQLSAGGYEAEASVGGAYIADQPGLTLGVPTPRCRHNWAPLAERASMKLSRQVLMFLG